MSKFLILIGLAAVALAVVEFLLPGVKYKIRRWYTKQRLLSLPNKEYIVVKDIPVETASGRINIDYVVVSVYGFFVIQEKPYGGRIFGKVDGEKWTRLVMGKEHSMRNPLEKTKQQLAYLKTVLNAQVADFIPIVLFSGGGSSWVETSVNVIPGFELKSTIRSYKTRRFDIYAIQDYAIRLNELRDRRVRNSRR